jgi:DNA (cytosine-5)-methyltransferase 1
MASEIGHRPLPYGAPLPKLEAFMNGELSIPRPRLPSLSLFSGAGIGDYGYKLAGFRFRVFADLERKRLDVCQANNRGSVCVSGDLTETWPEVVRKYRSLARGCKPALMTGMPPCEAMSWANSWVRARPRGKFSTDPRNELAIVVTRVAHELKPRVLVMENVIGILSTRIRDEELGKTDTVAQIVVDRLPDYECWPAIVQFADYGVPQRRLRTLLTFIRRGDLAARSLLRYGALPYPAETHDRYGRLGRLPWIAARDFLGEPRFPSLDSRSPETARDPADPLHFVPVYNAQRYALIERIPPHTGKSAYDTDICPACGAGRQSRTEARCWSCSSPLWTRPIVLKGGDEPRLIIGSNTAYSRMPADLPVATVTTANGHIGSDAKIHPWENRLLSPRECSDAQTIPWTFRWPFKDSRGNGVLLRSAIGDAIPPWFTYLHGRVLAVLLRTR